MAPDQGACILTEENIATEDDCTTHEHETDVPAVVGPTAQQIIDKGLSDALGRSLISSDEVTNMLLDLRRLLVPDKG